MLLSCAGVLVAWRVFVGSEWCTVAVEGSPGSGVVRGSVWFLIRYPASRHD